MVFTFFVVMCVRKKRAKSRRVELREREKSSKETGSHRTHTKQGGRMGGWVSGGGWVEEEIVDDAVTTSSLSRVGL